MMITALEAYLRGGYSYDIAALIGGLIGLGCDWCTCHPEQARKLFAFICFWGKHKMTQDLRCILNLKAMAPQAERPEGMETAGWCWKTEGGYMAIWADLKGAVNWDGETIMGRVSYNKTSQCWTVWFTSQVAPLADVYHTYDLDGMEA